MAMASSEIERLIKQGIPGEIGVHIQAPGIAATALARLERIFPKLVEQPLNTASAQTAPRPPLNHAAFCLK